MARRKDGRPRSLPLPEFAKRPDWEFDVVTNRPLAAEPRNEAVAKHFPSHELSKPRTTETSIDE